VRLAVPNNRFWRGGASKNTIDNKKGYQAE